MGFQPQVTATGLAGWRLLQKTETMQKTSFEKAPELKREIEYFTANIGKVKTAADLVADRRLLTVALGAFGLDADIDKKAFVRKLLESDTTDASSLASRLTEPAYKKLSAAFGFGGAGGAQTAVVGFAKKITDAYKTRKFESAIGESDENMRLALNFKREIADLAAGEKGGSWYSVIGSKSLGEVVTKAFALPSSFGKLDVDRQRDILRDKSKELFGSADLSVFQDTKKVDKLIDRFLARKQIEASSQSTSGSSILSLFNSSNNGSSTGLFNLIGLKPED